MMKPQYLIFIIVLCLLVSNCVEPYMPEEISDNPAYLVVNGSLNASKGSATITLTRSVALSSNETPPPLTMAAVYIQQENGPDFQLTETAPGVYTNENISSDVTKRYRLRIVAGSEYVSDYVAVKQTPDIEDLTFNVKSDEVEIIISTSDKTTENSYFRWTYNETWEYTSSYTSSYFLRNGQAILRSPDNQINRCWRTVPAYRIAVGTSEENISNSIQSFVLQSINRSSSKLSSLYSINVEQMSLTQEAYTYWLNLKKTSENLGGLFDPMPGQVTGNIQRTDNLSEPVIGFFSAATVREKRIFISRGDLPDDFGNYRNPVCKIDTILLEELPNYSDAQLLLQPVISAGPPVPIGYTSADPSCVDCRISGGGVSVKPDFWP